MLGSAFTPEITGHIAAWSGAVLVLLGFLVVTMALAVAFLRFGAGMDRATAYFSGHRAASPKWRWRVRPTAPTAV